MPRQKSTEKNISTEIKARRSSKIHDHDESTINYHESENKKALHTIEKNYQQILDMQNRILSAPAMNGGFSTLLYKVESIEQSQAQLVSKIGQIHDVLYEPDQGLYARIKKVENDTVDTDNFEVIKKDVQEIISWKNEKEKTEEKTADIENENFRMLHDHDKTLKELQKWHEKHAALVKWIALTAGGGIVGLIGKLFWSYFSAHIQIV